MRPFIKRVCGVAVIGLAAGLVPLLAASPAAAAPGPQPPPTVTPNPVPLNTSNFDLSNGTCDGTAGAGWRVQTFIVNSGVDVGTLVFDQGVSSDQVGTDRDNTDSTIRSPLWKDNAPGTGYNPAGSPAGLINPADLQGFDFSNSGWALTDGAYQIGYACISDLGTTAQWWAQTVTIDTTPGGGSSFMVVGSAAPTPVIVDGPDDADSAAVSVDNGSITIDFDGTGADNWTAQASTVSGDFSSPVGTSTTATSQSQNITISGLANGTPYFVRVLANKAGFGPVPSAQSGPHSPSTSGGAVQNLAVTDSGLDNGAGQPFVDVEWDVPAPVPGCTVNSYQVTYSSGTTAQPDPSPDGTPGTGGTARVNNVATNTNVTVTVTPVFAAGCTGVPASVSTIVQSGNVVIQDIDVTRPIGALVLTQICGANGALPGEGRDATGAAFPSNFDPAGADTPGDGANDLSVAVLGFDSNNALPPIDAVGSSTVVAPSTIANGGPSLSEDAPGGPQTNVDPNYSDGEYPYPTDGNSVADPADETHCGLDLGVAEFVTQGAGAGQYFAADAAMNQVTIVDTRNVDNGWTVTGKVSDFVATTETDDGSGPLGAADTFSGDFVGWTPVVTEDTPAFDSDADGTPNYDQAVVAGARVAPNTNDGLGVDSDGETLATAAIGAGLGTAILDARIKLLIPVTADAGFYEADLTFSAV